MKSNVKAQKKEQKKAQQMWQESCTKMLPGFLSQLLLLLNSGVILSDAFRRIAERYEELPERQKNQFTNEISALQKQSQLTGENVIRLFYKKSQTSGVRELARVAGIMAASLETGADLWDKLEEQGDGLWEARKRLVMEKIRLSESKMSFPLGLLMIALLLVTAAPAMLQI